MADNNYTLGRGKLYFDKFADGTKTLTGERYFGNTPDISQTVDSTSLDHYNSDAGVKEKDESIILQTDRTGSFSTDNISPENIALFFLGSSSLLTNAAGTGVISSFAAVKANMRYQLGAGPANPAGLSNVTSVVVTDGAAESPVTYVVNVDYTVDADTGGITVLDTGSIPDGGPLKVTFNTLANTRSMIISGSAAIEGALRYISANPAGGQLDYYWPYVKITPNGDFTLKGDDWQVIPFNLEILKLDPYEAVYALTRGVLTV